MLRSADSSVRAEDRLDSKSVSYARTYARTRDVMMARMRRIRS